eukprot:CAMPEP_0205915440 /NCGR_PEP_ID=MMETSP1325-20131115/7873_1 /ASSEMBLY_ACC=CAM_ASM_000708 /TAXON_ID=236786 /ORGANISM="Florenciella sp., Strain RCC1007" /LENGTH=73 /DNA_ID=CAMNT_0053282613 /DNA_START=50 /DNA_END=271 /DNA_ORIENTATION=-
MKVNDASGFPFDEVQLSAADTTDGAGATDGGGTSKRLTKGARIRAEKKAREKKASEAAALLRGDIEHQNCAVS